MRKNLIVATVTVVLIGLISNVHSDDENDFESTINNDGGHNNKDIDNIEETTITSTDSTTNVETNDDDTSIDKLIISEKWKPLMNSFKSYCMYKHKTSNETLDLLKEKNWDSINKTKNVNHTKCFTECYLRTLDIYSMNYLVPGRFRASFEFTNEFKEMLSNEDCEECKEADEKFLDELKRDRIDEIVYKCRNETVQYKSQDTCTKAYKVYQCLTLNNIELLS